MFLFSGVGKVSSTRSSPAPQEGKRKPDSPLAPSIFTCFYLRVALYHRDKHWGVVFCPSRAYSVGERMGQTEEAGEPPPLGADLLT